MGDPDFGSNLRTIIYDQINDDLPELLIDDIVTNLTIYEPRIYITENDVMVTYDGDRVRLYLSYIERNTGRKYSLDLAIFRGDKI